MSESVITLMPSLLFQSHEMVPQLFGDVSMCFITSTCSLNSLLVVCDLILLCSATQADLTTCFVYRHSSATDESRAIAPKLFIALTHFCVNEIGTLRDGFHACLI